MKDITTKIAIVPTKRKTRFIRHMGQLILIFGNHRKIPKYVERVHIYLTCDSGIMENDWCYDRRPDENGKMIDLIYQKKKGEGFMDSSTERKIIATTDELWVDGFRLPIPNEDFQMELTTVGDVDEVKVTCIVSGYCAGCNRSGMRHCAHADTCGQNVEIYRAVVDEDNTIEPKFIAHVQ